MSNDSQKEADARSVSMVYTNWRGITSVRNIVPLQIFFETTDWHPEKQWLLLAYDIEKNAERSFAIKDIQYWGEKI